MKKALAILASIGIIALTISVVATDSQAFLDKLRKDKKDRGTIIAVGQYSGSFKGDIRIGHEKFVVNDMTGIYFNGEGMKSQDTYVTNRQVWVAARVVNGKPTATRIVVQPDPNRPRPRSATSDRTPSEVNPDVGIVNVTKR